MTKRAWLLIAWLAVAGCDPSPFEGAGPTLSEDERAARSERVQSDGGTSERERDAGMQRTARGEKAEAGQGGQKARAGSRGEAGESGAGVAGEKGNAAGSGGEPASAGASGGAGQAAEVCQRADPDAPVRLGEVHEIGTVSSPASVVLRIPGPISWIGGKLLWLFPKTNRSMGAVGADAAPNQPHAAYIAREEPLKLEEDLDPDGVPRRFLTADDVMPNTELWPTALLRSAAAMGQDAMGGVAFVRRTNPDLSYDVMIGRVARNTTTAQEPLTALFTGSEGKFSTGAFRGSEYAYLFACYEDMSVAERAELMHFPCKIARAKNAEIEQRDSYRVYDPSRDNWVSDLSAGGPVLYGPSSLLSLSHNNYLGRYIAVHSRWFSNQVIVQSAKSPWGPWRQEFAIDLPTPAASVILAAAEQPALLAPMECARSIWISYLSPTAAADGYPSEGEIKLIRADLD